MKLPRASMTTTLFVTLVLVVDIWVARDLLLHDRGTFSVLGLGFLPMATALVFGLYRLLRLAGRSDSFTRGFVTIGLAVSIGYLATIQKVPVVDDALSQLAQAMDDRLATVLPPSLTDVGKVMTASEWFVAATILSLPTLLVGLSGGFLTHRMAQAREAVQRRERLRASRRPRFTLGSVTLLIAVLAVDFGVIRHLLMNPWSFWTTFGIGFLPMANALVLGLPRMLKRRGRRHPFLLGFEVAGWLATVAYLAACAIAPSAVMSRLQSFAGAILVASDFLFGSGQTQLFFTRSVYAGVTAEIVLVVIFFTLPPLLLALFGGAITRQFGRRSARAA